jgi:predicted dehydrogenase
MANASEGERLMADKIRVGIVGATVTQGGSGWGAHAHVPALHAMPDFELTAVCTAHQDTAEASAKAFGAKRAFHDIDAMVADPDIDLVVVSVRVPGHYGLVMKALEAGKPAFCEWPLGADLREAQTMADLARERGLPTAVGLQAQSDPTLMYAREIIRNGDIGEVLAANLSVISQATTERGEGRIWQAYRKNGANTMTISGGHAIDALCFVLGEFSEVSARLAVRIPEWHNTDTGDTVAVDSPDCISLSGRLESGAEVAVQVATVMSNPTGNRFEIFGSEGTLSITARSANLGPNTIYGGRGKESLAEMETPDRFKLVPEGTPAGQARNVAQAYVRLADSIRGGDPFDPDFDHAVKRHKLIEAMERSDAEGRTVRL